MSQALWSKLFYEFHTTCPRYSWRNIIRLLRSCTSLYDTCTSSAICYESHMTFLRHVYEFLRVCRSSARLLASLYGLVRYTTICFDIYTRLVRQRTNLARLSTISHDFYTTSDAFKNNFLIWPQERNKYDFTAMTVHFSTHFCTFSWNTYLYSKRENHLVL